MNKIIILTISILIQLYTNAQSNVNKDPRIDALIKQEGQVVSPATSPQIVGYRIQLFFDDNKTAVDEARAKFLNMHPKVDTYVIYNAPNYFLKAGDFRSQMDAEKVKATVDAQFPTAFIVKEKVNLPRVD
jgi:hypothetical protein